MRKFQDSIKALQADIDHANAMASEFLRDYDGSVIQMRVAYSAVAHFLLQWTDCKLAGALGLLKVMLYKVCADGSSALPDWEMEASIREFYGVIFPSLLQLPSGITELDDRKQRKLCLKKFRSRDEQLSEVDTERELECGICLEVSPKVVLPDCAHMLCMRCFEDWYEYGYNFIPMSGYEFFNEYNFISRTSIGKHYLMGTYPLLSLHMLPWQTLEEGSRPANFLERIKRGLGRRQQGDQGDQHLKERH
ncbi:E3 ubiquitin-protein ligase AIRP2 isoform X2 [Zea mays]|uniref:E3 ubiquitin-protein ligase AIRP2 isoform X2 n=1 Tax=Zea mays TaxID=4577 RepID=UPI0004DEA498|nr:uncharacterized protein LOC100217218 isoform X2 [Zea mays]|eukprot:XP_008665871.1 uncharacterized protein LOC100217218 isoform X2 [Zea mays]